MRQLLHTFFKKARELFDFHQPRFSHFDCIDLVLENKLLLLLSWNTVHTYKLRICPGKHVFRQPAGAAICRLPFGTNTVDIILYNAWRSTRVTFPLKRIEVTRQVFQYMYTGPLTGAALSVACLQPHPLLLNVQLKKICPQTLIVPEISTFNISINHFQLSHYVP